MELSNRFEVEAPATTTWDLLMDVPRVVPCMPGAQLVEAVAEDRWKIEMKTKLGPMSMTFDADVARSAVDAENRVVTLDVRARERRGRGQAKATIASGLQPLDGERTEVDVQTTLALSGRIGQFGRGAVQDVAAEMTDRFTANLRQSLGQAEDEDFAPDPYAAMAAWPVLFGALRRRLARLFAAIRGRG
jgi:carbon monoxide dehydrogenase subunit G